MTKMKVQNRKPNKNVQTTKATNMKFRISRLKKEGLGDTCNEYEGPDSENEK